MFLVLACGTIDDVPLFLTRFPTSAREFAKRVTLESVNRIGDFLARPNITALCSVGIVEFNEQGYPIGIECLIPTEHVTTDPELVLPDAPPYVEQCQSMMKDAL